jgi:hypothetical protein
MGLVSGLWAVENKRNSDNEDLFRAIITEVYPEVDLVVAGHHIFVRRAGSPGAEEIPSADHLIFDHEIAQKIWGNNWRSALEALALEPAETRDSLLRTMYMKRDI